MAMEAAVEVGRAWANHEADLMRRLHQIVSGTGDGPFEKGSGYRWQLDASNDWWAELNGAELKVANRYSADKAKALAELCKHLFPAP